MTRGPVGGSLLIVDDEPGGREALEGLLLNQGYRLTFAEGGQEALEVINHLLPDLILLDVMMPGMDGFEVCRTLRANPVTAEIPVLLVTALDDRETRLEGISAGADDFISKPYDRAELRLRVKTIMRIGRYRRLLTERARFNSVVETALNGYVVVDGGGGIIYANQSARRSLNLGDVTAAGGYGDFFQQARKQYRLEPDLAWTDEELVVPDRHHLVRPETPTASAFWLSITLMHAPDPESGERLLRLRDVTDELGVQRDRHSFQRIIGHKLRTPLNGIVAVLDLLNQELEGKPSRELATLAMDSAERLARSVEEILQFAALSSRSAQGERFDLAGLPELLGRLQKEMEIEALHSEIDPPVLKATLTLSSLDFETICRELFENARKFHPSRKPALKLTAAVQAHVLHLTLSDDGVNLSPDQLAQAWTPYYQGEKRMTGEVAGMGLGLTVIKSIIISKGGNIKLMNNPSGPGVQVKANLQLA